MKCALPMDDLIELSEYQFRVMAENDAGLSNPSDSTGKFIAKDPFDVPGRPDAPVVEEITKETANLSWNPPTSDGGSPISNYIVEFRRSGDIKWSIANRGRVTPDTTFTVTGLIEETQYEFRVTAENKGGQGQPSPPSRPAKFGKIFNILQVKYGTGIFIFSLIKNQLFHSN